MRLATVFVAMVATGSAAAVSSADHYLKIEGVGREAGGPGTIYLQVRSSGDIDGDQIAEEGILRLNCAGGEVRGVHFRGVKSPRDAATGQASGQRTHHPVTFVKEWGPASPQLRAMQLGWDIKKNEGGRIAPDAEGWSEVSLTGTEGLCAAAEEVKVKATKSRSNIQNN